MVTGDAATASSHPQVVTIARRFRGPPESANGGYACGLLACRLHGPARVRLHRPPPLERALSLESDGGTHVLLRDDAVTIAEGASTQEQWHVPGAVTFDQATQAATRYAGFEGHPFPECFVCGPERMPGDGLRIFPGAIVERGVVAAPWIPDDALCDASGAVQPEIVWAALDCPSWFGVHAFEPTAGLALLGQMSARIVRRPRAGERCVVIGWTAGRDGRKLFGGTAIFGSDDALVGTSSAIWIELKNT
jgi:hypothetical protein